MIYEISHLIVRVIAKVYFRVRVIGKENIPEEGGCIIVANHTSFLDPLLICTLFSRVVHYITYAYFYYLRGLHWYCKRVYCIPLKKNGKDISAFRTALRLLRQGELIGIFPEGMRSEDGKLGTAEPGVALLALKSGVPIIPVGIVGAYESFPRHARFPKPLRIIINLGKPFTLDEYLDTSNLKSVELQKEAIDLIMKKIAAMCVPQELLTQNVGTIYRE